MAQGGTMGETPRRIPKPRVVGSNPIARSNAGQDCVSAISPSPETAEKADAHPLREAAEALLLAKQVAGCTARTVSTYAWWLRRFTAAPAHVTPLTVRAFFVVLQSTRQLGLPASGAGKRTCSAEVDVLPEAWDPGCCSRPGKDWALCLIVLSITSASP